MKYSRPDGLLAGFHVVSPDSGVPELSHAGEQWVPKEFLIPRHHHDRWEMYLQASGESEWRTPGRIYRIKPNALFAVPPGLEHAMDDRPNAKHHFFYAAIDMSPILDRITGLSPEWSGPAIVHIEQAGSLVAPFRQLIREVSLQMPLRSAGIRTALDALIIEASRLIRRRDEAPSELAAPFIHPAALRAKELMELHPNESWSIEDLARIIGVSPSHLAQCFTRDIGLSVHRYLIRRRIETAQEILATTDIPITQLALDLGFSSSQHFANTYRRITAQTPREYRTEMAHNSITTS